VLAAALVLAWLAFAGSVAFRPHRGQFDPWFDVGLYNVPFLLTAYACWTRPDTTSRTCRSGWRVLAGGFVLFTAANVHGSLLPAEDGQPGLADAGWLLFYVVLYVAIVQLIRSRTSRFHPSSWLDGAVGGLGAAALATAFALGPVLGRTGASGLQVTVNLAYPTADLVLVVLLVAAGTATGVRDAAWWCLMLGLSVFAVSDIGFLLLSAAGSYSEGGWLDLGWPLGVTIVGLATCVRASPSGAVESAQRFAVPAGFTIASVGLLVYGQHRALPALAVALAVASLAAGAIRVRMTVREVVLLAESRREARTDDLTGLANRRDLFERLTGELAEPQARTAMLLLDLDRFKEVNDSLGHLAGDRLLHAISERLSPQVPAGGLLARLGGDEFAVVLPGSSLDAAVGTAERLREVLREPFTMDGMLIPVDVSIGVAAAPDHAGTAEAMMTCADIAMYRAKRARTGVELFRAGQDQPSLDRMTMLGELHVAIAEQQLTLYYQPQLDLRTGQVWGLEALVRWQHPTRGLIQPDRFLGLAEQFNLMPAVTSFVLGRALADLADLHGRGHLLRVSVNVSAADLIDATLPELVELHLAEAGLPPETLVVEVTEDTVMADRVRALQVLHRLRAAGVHVSVDDYGTGQSSLSYLRDLPISEIKLDRAFLSGVPDDTHNAAIVRSTIELAHALELPIVTEGVEEGAALEWLREVGCDLAQGYHIARPLPLEELIAWLTGTGTAASLGTPGVPEPRRSAPLPG
jgi:diguanylate cyclase